MISPSDVVLLEGILVFYNSDIRDMFDMKLFVDTDADTRLARRGKGLFINDVTLRGGGWDIIYVTDETKLRFRGLFRIKLYSEIRVLL